MAYLVLGVNACPPKARKEKGGLVATCLHMTMSLASRQLPAPAYRKTWQYCVVLVS